MNMQCLAMRLLANEWRPVDSGRFVPGTVKGAVETPTEQFVQ